MDEKFKRLYQQSQLLSSHISDNDVDPIHVRLGIFLHP